MLKLFGRAASKDTCGAFFVNKLFAAEYGAKALLSGT
jgi:hypothetical protein